MLRPPVPSYDSELSIPIGQAGAEPDEKQIPNVISLGELKVWSKGCWARCPKKHVSSLHVKWKLSCWWNGVSTWRGCMFGTNTLLQCLGIATVARQNTEGAMAKVREDLKARKGRVELSNDSLRHGLRLGKEWAVSCLQMTNLSKHTN